MDFRFLKTELGLSDGNLGRHLRTLSEAGLISFREGYSGRKTRVWIGLTPLGQTAFKREVALLKPIVEAAEKI